MTSVRTKNVSPEQIHTRHPGSAQRHSGEARSPSSDTTVIGAKGMIEELTAAGIRSCRRAYPDRKILSVLRKMERDKAKAAGKKTDLTVKPRNRCNTVHPQIN